MTEGSPEQHPIEGSRSDDAHAPDPATTDASDRALETNRKTRPGDVAPAVANPAAGVPVPSDAGDDERTIDPADATDPAAALEATDPADTDTPAADTAADPAAAPATAPAAAATSAAPATAPAAAATRRLTRQWATERLTWERIRRGRTDATEVATGRAPLSARLAILIALAAAAVGIAVLAGWIARIDLLESFFPNGLAAKVNSAISAVCLGLATALRVWGRYRFEPRSRAGRVAIVGSTVLALIALGIALVTLFEYISGTNVGIDEALFDDGVPVPGEPYPGRIPIPTTIDLALGSVALLALARRVRAIHPTQIAAIVVGSVGALALLGYVYEVPELTSFGSPTLVTLPMSIALILLGLALIGADPEHGLVRQLGDPGLAGQVARRMVPAAIVVLPVIGFIRIQAERAGVVSPNAAVLLMIAVSALILLSVTAWTAARVLDVEAERNAVRRDRDRFFELSNDLVLVTDMEGRMLQLSPSWRTVLGRSLEEVTSRPFMDFVHPDDQAMTASIFGRQLHEGYNITGFRNRYRRADGAYRWLEWTSRPDLAEGRVYAVARDVTERATAEAELREASLYARGLLEASLDPLVTISLDGKITDVNQATEEATGRTRGELIGTDFASYFTEPKQARAGYRKVLRDGLLRDYPLTIRQRSGRTVDVLYNATVFRNHRGDVQGVFAAARDVTERRKADEAVARLAAIVESSTDAIFATDRDDHLVAWNPAAERIFGYTEAEAIGQHATMTSPLDLRPLQLHHAAEAFEGRPQLYESLRQRKDGSVFHAEATVFPVRGPDGQVMGLSTILRDVTAQYEAREKLREQAGLLELAHDAIIVRDFDGTIRFWNAGAQRTYGWDADEALGQITHELLTTQFPESLAALDAQLRATGEWEGRLIHRTRDGGTVMMESRQVVERNQAGEVVGILEINRDVTEAAAAHRQLEEYADELRRSNQELEQFAYVASHDLQEPLRMVTGFVGLLQRRYGGQLGADADEYIEFAVEGAHRMQGLINDLLAYSRVGTRGREPEPTDLSEVVEEALENLRVTIAETDALVVCDKLPTVPADRHQMVQLFQNLVANGIKFHAETRPEIRIGAQRDRHAWRLFVRDNGIGIAPEHQEQIFVIFRRLHSREAYPGSGIGLAICKKIVERHGGRIWVESSPGEGATFWFTIPDGERSGGGR